MSETIKEETAEAVQAEPQGLTLEKFEEPPLRHSFWYGVPS